MDLLKSVVGFPRRLINFLYWKTIGDMTIYGKFNGKTIIMGLKGGKIDRLYIQAGGRIDHVHFMGRQVDAKEFQVIQSTYNR